MLESSITEIAVAAVTVAVGAAFYFGAPKPAEDGTIQPPETSTTTRSSKKSKKNKKKTLPGMRVTSGEESTAAEDSTPSPVPKPKEKEVTPKPETPPVAPATKSKKKKKSKAQVPSSIETTLAGPSQSQSSTHESSSANDGPWTRVETRKRGKVPHAPAAVLSDGLTTSVTGTEDEQEEPAEAKRTLAERLLPSGPKTGVEDVLETPQYPDIARVESVKPTDPPQPAPGYSLGDYEDADENKVVSMDDDDTDGGWGVVQSRKPRRSQTVTQASANQAAKQSTDTQSMTKKQRQNAAKRDATKAVKAETESERLAKLEAHKRALERERIDEAYAKPDPGKNKASGGMTASVNEKGSLVWE